MKKRILVIEDRQDWQDILRDALEEEGYIVDTVRSLEEAMQLLKRNYHFITVDMNLHDEEEREVDKLEGWPILNFVEKVGLRSKTPVMVITALGKDHEVVKGLKKIKFLPVMLKTEFNRSEFLEIVKRYTDAANLTFFDGDNN